MSWYVYLPLSLNSANQTRSKSVFETLWLSKISRHPTWHAPNVTSPHLIAPKSFGATECPENVDEKPRRHESFDEKSSLFIGICWFTPWCMHSPEQIWYMERVFFCVIWVAYDMRYPFTIHFWWWCYRFYGRHALGVSAEMAHLCAGSSVKSSFAESFLKVWASVLRVSTRSACFHFSLWFRLFSPPFPTSTTLSNCSLADLGFGRAHRSTWSHATWSTGPLDHWTITFLVDT